MMSANRIRDYKTIFGYELGYDHTKMMEGRNIFWALKCDRAGLDRTYKQL
jgi:hypothetical protein